ncbi:hypothetical protein PHLCEN_2v2344 [Hermanssonia centrifuga]|uniref:F-box domain-containing protein n=1 Tax=Hermanssonia centrifuga TaxID=98765 RepID=A0A2R6RM60_9APHY|nr:hypothetical protein PHLCEN_2v2344 [Hermanssonia centrifuga]
MHNSKSLNFLSLELHLRIVQLLDPTSRLALLRVARRFYWTLRNHVAILNLGYLTSLSLSTPFCLRDPCTFPADSPSYWSESSEDEDEGEGEGEITCGRTPLLVHKVALATTKAGSKGCTLTEKRLQLHVMSPHFVFGDHMCPFKVDRDRLFLDDPKKYWSSHPPRFSGRSFKHDRPWYKDDRRFVLDWVKHCANGANLVRATGPLMRTRVECRICRNGRCVRTTRVEFPSR